MKETAAAIEKWIASKVSEAKAKGVVVGISGGLDSGVAAVLARKALGRGKVLGLIMPCGSSPADAARASRLAERFGIRTEKVNLAKPYGAFLKALPGADEKTKGNLKARLRMAALYYFANRENYIVMGTSNKSEISIGYFTKHGDAAADIHPLGDLYKTQVSELAKFLGLPRSIISARPTAGLWEGQTDEGEIGISYGKLDRILMSLEQRKKPEGFDPRIVERVRKMSEESGHKRKMPEVCIIS